MEDYALASALLDACGRPANLEARALAVARKCVTQDSIDAVIARFREQVQTHSGKEWSCSRAQTKQLMQSYEKEIEKDLSKARWACRLRFLN